MSDHLGPKQIPNQDRHGQVKLWNPVLRILQDLWDSFNGAGSLHRDISRQTGYGAVGQDICRELQLSAFKELMSNQCSFCKAASKASHTRLSVDTQHQLHRCLLNWTKRHLGMPTLGLDYRFDWEPLTTKGGQVEDWGQPNMKATDAKKKITNCNNKAGCRITTFECFGP